MRGPRVAPSAVNGHYSLQMGTSNDDHVQETSSLYAELERVVQGLRLGDVQWTIETIGANGSDLRGFIKLGPITPKQARELAGDSR